MIFIVIPTIDGRQEFLERTLEGYGARTQAEFSFIVIHDAPTCGLAWQVGARQAVEVAQKWSLTEASYLHLTADDIVPGYDWDHAAMSMVHSGGVPIPLVVTPDDIDLDRRKMPLPHNPAPAERSWFFEGNRGLSEVKHGQHAQTDSEYPSVPFCSLAQWEQIGPMIASHYGTDKWFGYRARAAGIPCVVEPQMVFYHYAATPGRVPSFEGWYHRDLITFDQIVAFDAYHRGALAPHEQHAMRGTQEGLDVVRAWFQTNCPPDEDGTYYWEKAP